VRFSSLSAILRPDRPDPAASTENTDTIIAALPTLDAGGLDHVRAALEAVSRRSKGSTVLEYRSYVAVSCSLR
jgi:hypothetical protein